MLIDLKEEILTTLASPEGQSLLREILGNINGRTISTGAAIVGSEVDGDRLMTAKEAAEFLGMTERAVRQAAHRGTLPAVHLGRRLRFRRGDLLRSAA